MIAEPTLHHTRDVVVIGCSAGGVEALPRILQQFSDDLEAAVLIVQHLAAGQPRYLADILRRASRLPVAWAEQGAEISRGRVLVAPPDVHMVISERHVQLTKGARENHARPSIDKLFHSAAAACGSRVIGVLLTGMLDDGVAGLRAIRQAGGVVIVQDPRDAAFPELPGRALHALVPDQTLRIDEIGAAITAIVGDRVGAAATPSELALESETDRGGAVSPDTRSMLGSQTVLTCPECHGPLWKVGDEELRRFRCYLGHASTATELLRASSLEIESALWSAVRALNDRATTLETLAADSTRIGDLQSAQAYEIRGREARKQAELARQFMLDVGRPR
jgi:two-component system, chemotaxis family, protein-glutamate methylesterase/glutaminase